MPSPGSTPRLRDAGIARTGEVEQTRIRPWGTLLAIPTSGGRLWLKAAAPATAFEVALYPLLHRLAPGTVLEPLAVDTSQGCLLLPYGGTHLSELAAEMETTLPRYAEVQRAMASKLDAMVALGIADMRPQAQAGADDVADGAVAASFHLLIDGERTPIYDS